jgi:hypothetical protein
MRELLNGTGMGGAEWVYHREIVVIPDVQALARSLAGRAGRRYKRRNPKSPLI